ncbi:flagellar hook-length control protein FliK [Vibrio salinus]|uniref:flagellar hook-length control protein FliK n=1 Tax=Vibrio salinus TaxID=2899784 RepID=UPI001E605245|nr:flagellar hook-length control protein FliK [Vibrio salinus]MCE0494526.1 flagellar hook-length control protein FliK [Vibrio salinus]
MKINFGSTSDVPNVKTGLKADGKSEQSSDENEGFFSKLASFFSGDNDAGSQVDSVKEGTTVKAGADTGEGELPVGDAAKAQIDSDTQVKNLESQEGMELASDLAGNSEFIADQKRKPDVESSKVLVKHSDSDPAMALSKSGKTIQPADDVSQVMDEGKLVLNRLKEANATLSPGKGLPQTYKGDESDLISTDTKLGEKEIAPEVQADMNKFASAENVKKNAESEFDSVAEQLTMAYPTKETQHIDNITHHNKDHKGKQADILANGSLPVGNPVPGSISYAQKPEGADLVDPSLAENAEYQLSDESALSGIDLNQVQAVSQNGYLQKVTPSDAVNMVNAIDAGVSDAAEVSPQQLQKMTKREKEALLTQHGLPPSLAELPSENPAMYFAPGVAAGMMDESSQSASIMFVDTDGKVIDLGVLNKPELEKLAHRHGQTVSQLISGAMQTNVTQHHQSQLVSMQMPEKQNADFLQSATNLAPNSAMNNAAMNEAASQMTKNMAKSFEHKNGLVNMERFSDIREIDGDRVGKDAHIAQQISTMSNQSTHSLSQVSRADASQAPVQINKDNASDQLAERINVMLSKNLKNIDIRLDPPDLGKVHIRMHMNGDATSVQFTVANHHAREALESSMPRLREMLSQQGVQVGDTAVQHQSGQQQNGYAASGRGQNGQPQSDGSALDAGFWEENNESDVTLRVNVPSPKDGISYYA